MLRRLFGFIFLSVLLWGCDPMPLPNITTRLGYQYVPIGEGRYWEYEIEDIRYPVIGDIDTTRFLVREEISKIFSSTVGDTIWQIDRYSKAQLSEDWRLDSLWLVRKTASQVIRTENNVPTVKMVFPVEEGKVWDGNAFNVKDSAGFFMEEVGRPLQIGDVVYKDALRVVQNNQRDTLIQQDFVFEIFAATIGMVLRESRQFRYCNDDDCLGKQIIETGRHFRQQLIEYGEL